MYGWMEIGEFFGYNYNAGTSGGTCSSQSPRVMIIHGSDDMVRFCGSIGAEFWAMGRGAEFS